MVTDQALHEKPHRWRRLGAPVPGGAHSRSPYGWAPAVVMFLVALVDRMEFSLLPAVLQQLQDEWGFSDTVAGSIPFASAITTMVLALPAGLLADRYDRGRIIMIVVAVWSLATLGSALAPGLLVFYLVRVLLAGAEAVDNPAAASLLGDWYPGPSRATVFGWWRSASYLGGLGLLVGGVLAELLGWRGVFLVMTIPGVLVAILVSMLREPPRGQVDRDHAVQVLGNGDRQDARPDGGAAAGHAAPVRSIREKAMEVLRIRTLWGTGAALAVTSFAVGAIVYWTPSLFQREFGLREAASGSLAGGVSLVGVVGGALFAARITRWAAPEARATWSVLIGGCGLLAGSVFMGLALLSPGWRLFSLGVLLFAFFSAFAVPTLTACVADVIPASDRGMGFGLLQVAATTGGALGPLVVGAVSDATGSLRTGIWVVVPLLAVSGLLALAARSTVDGDTRAALGASLDRR